MCAPPSQTEQTQSCQWSHPTVDRASPGGSPQGACLPLELRTHPAPGHWLPRLISRHRGAFCSWNEPLPTPGGPRSAAGSTLCVPGPGFTPLPWVLPPLHFGLEVLNLPAQVGDDARVLVEVAGHVQQVALDLEGQDTPGVRASGLPGAGNILTAAHLRQKRADRLVAKIQISTTPPQKGDADTSNVDEPQEIMWGDRRQIQEGTLR